MSIPRIENLFEQDFMRVSRIGTATNRSIDKRGYVYHVITTSWRKLWIFFGNVARYRQDLLCELCAKKGVTILFSVTMMNHTHEVFITPDWETLSSIIRTVNSNVAKYIRSSCADKVKDRKKIFSSDPRYIMVVDIVHLFCLGKYIFDNPRYLIDQGKSPPDSCFWMFESNHFIEPYKARVYETLFGMTAQQLYELYSTKSSEEVREFAVEHFKSWTKRDNERLFLRVR